MKKYHSEYHSRLFFGFLIIAASFGVSARAHADTVTLSPTAGVDTTSGSSVVFSASDVAKVSLSDDNRIQSNGNWPAANAYDESKYMEFDFAFAVPANATITSAIVTHEFRRTGALGGAKIEAWNGTQFIDEPATLGSINVDHADSDDISSLITAPSQANALKVRFLAYRATAGSTKTSTDYISVSITYVLPPVNTPPVTVGQTISILDNAPITVTLGATDADNDPLSYSIVAEPAQGTLGAVSGNSVVYTPNRQAGSDSFTFKANDGKSDSNISSVAIVLTDPVSNTDTSGSVASTDPSDTTTTVDVVPVATSDSGGSSVPIVPNDAVVTDTSTVPPDGGTVETGDTAITNISDTSTTQPVDTTSSTKTTTTVVETPVSQPINTDIPTVSPDASSTDVASAQVVAPSPELPAVAPTSNDSVNDLPLSPAPIAAPNGGHAGIIEISASVAETTAPILVSTPVAIVTPVPSVQIKSVQKIPHPPVVNVPAQHVFASSIQPDLPDSAPYEKTVPPMAADAIGSDEAFLGAGFFFGGSLLGVIAIYLYIYSVRKKMPLK